MPPLMLILIWRGLSMPLCLSSVIGYGPMILSFDLRSFSYNGVESLKGDVTTRLYFLSTVSFENAICGSKA